MRNAECGMRNAECGMRNAECGMRNAECGMRNAGCGMRNAECGIRNAERGVRNAAQGANCKLAFKLEAATRATGTAQTVERGKGAISKFVFVVFALGFEPRKGRKRGWGA